MKVEEMNMQTSPELLPQGLRGAVYGFHTGKTSVTSVVSACLEKIVEEKRWSSGGQLSAYNGHSLYFAVEQEGSVVGGLQLVLGNEEGHLPVRSVWPELPLAGRFDVADVALLAVATPQRGEPDVYWHLCVVMWRWCVENGITELWAEVTPRNLRIYQRLGWPFTVGGPLRPHWGEDCYPCCLYVQEVYRSIAARAAQGNSSRYRRI